MNSVKLIATTVATVVNSGMSTGELVAYCARVSNPTNQHNQTSAPKLLKYLVANQHWSPFEMAHMVLEISTTRDIARQILRHRSFSFQEFSQRYSEVVEKPILRAARLQDTKNRQNSLPNDDTNLDDWWSFEQGALSAHAEDLYNEALLRGIAKEVARAVLPEGLTTSRLYMAGSIRSWIHYIQVRTTEGTQKEHRDIANMCKDVLLLVVPELTDVLGVK